MEFSVLETVGPGGRLGIVGICPIAWRDFLVVAPMAGSVEKAVLGSGRNALSIAHFKYVNFTTFRPTH